MYMLARNRVVDFDAWDRIFASHAEAHRAAGLHLEHLWQGLDDPNELFFLFRVEDRARAEAFVASPESAQAGKDAGVLEGSYSYVEDVGEP